MVKGKAYQSKVVTIGGGTGSSNLLRGLKQFTERITAVVTVADDGGGSGKLREELGILPPGDARNCLFALANREPALTQAFDYRFKEGSLKGQSLGNLFVAAMSDIYGSFDIALKEIGNILAISGQVLPMTLENVKLCALLENGSRIEGESILPEEVVRRHARIKKLYLEPQVKETLPETLEAIQEADIILLGPGSLYTSLIPNLLVEDLRNAVAQSKAQVFYICNLMTQRGETDDFGVKEHYEVLEQYLGENVVQKIFVNNERIPETERIRYETHGEQHPIFLKEEERAYFDEKIIEIVEGEFISLEESYVRHDAYRLCQAIFDHYTHIYRG